jgi:hypothetical protein
MQILKEISNAQYKDLVLSSSLVFYPKYKIGNG